MKKFDHSNKNFFEAVAINDTKYFSTFKRFLDNEPKIEEIIDFLNELVDKALENDDDAIRILSTLHTITYLRIIEETAPLLVKKMNTALVEALGGKYSHLVEAFEKHYRKVLSIIRKQDPKERTFENLSIIESLKQNAFETFMEAVSLLAATKATKEKQKQNEKKPKLLH